MADDEIVEVIEIPPVIEIGNLTVSPDVRATLAITLINEIVVTGAEENQLDLTLFFLGFSQPTLTSLQRLIPTLVDVTGSLSTAQVYLGLASVTEQTRSEANKVRIVVAVDAKGDDFLLALERYRQGQPLLGLRPANVEIYN